MEDIARPKRPVSGNFARLGQVVVRIEPHVVVHGSGKALAAAEVALGRLHRSMAKQELDLLEFASRCMTQPGAGASQVVGCELFDASPPRVFTDDPPDGLLADAASPDPPRPAHPPEDDPLTELRRRKPLIQGRLHPRWDGNRPDVTTLPEQVDNSPVLIALLEMAEL